MKRTLSLVAASLLLFSTQSLAQHAQVRDGFTFSFGVGAGSAALSCPGCGTSPRETGASGYLRLGGAVSPNLVIAGESNGWVKTVDGVDSQLGTLAVVAQWYPAPTNGFYVKGGLGFSSYSESDAGLTARAVGPGYQIGTGYDLRVGQNFSLTPYVNFLGMGDADVKLNGMNVGEKLGTTNMQYGIGFTWH